MDILHRTPLTTFQMIALSSFWFGSAVWLYVFVLLVVPQEVEAIVEGQDLSVATVDQQAVRAQAKGAALGITLLCGALFATIAAPVVGAMSDSCDTRHRLACGLGRRVPWLLGGVAAACFAATALFFSTQSYWGYTVSFAALQLSISVGASPFTGLLSDVVLPSERGVMSGIVGACLALGNLFGAFLGALRPYTGRMGLYALCMSTVVLSALLTAWAVWALRAHRTSSKAAAKWQWEGRIAGAGSKEAGHRRHGNESEEALESDGTSLLVAHAGRDKQLGGSPESGPQHAHEAIGAGQDDQEGFLLAMQGETADKMEAGELQHREKSPAGTNKAHDGRTGAGALAGVGGRPAGLGSVDRGREGLPVEESETGAEQARMRIGRHGVGQSPPASGEGLEAKSNTATKQASPVQQRAGAHTGFFSAFADNDFFWAFWSRVSIQMGIFTVQEYLLLYLQYAVRLPAGLPPSQALSAAMVPLLLAALVAPLLVGSLSDYTGGQRRPMLYLAGGLMVCVAVGLVFCRSWGLLLPLAGLFGLGYGAFSALDLALALDVLPAAESDSARDLGLWNLALAAPLCVAAPVAGVLLDWGNRSLGPGNGFALLFAAAAVYIALGVAFLTRLSARVK